MGQGLEEPDGFKNKYKHAGEGGLKCKYCDEGAIMTQSLCVVCPAWGELRRGLDMTDIRDLVKFFRKLLEVRAKLDVLDV